MRYNNVKKMLTFEKICFTMEPSGFELLILLGVLWF